MGESDDKQLLGWREWVSLPALGIPYIKAKVDTGARTSALHAFELEYLDRDGVDLVRFALHPFQRDTDTVVTAEAPLVDIRPVTDSGGHSERRPVIRTTLEVAGRALEVELTLTERDSMMFRMLLGRTTLNQGFVVDPAASFATGKPPLTARRPKRRSEGDR